MVFARQRELLTAAFFTAGIQFSSWFLLPRSRLHSSYGLARAHTATNARASSGYSGIQKGFARLTAGLKPGSGAAKSRFSSPQDTFWLLFQACWAGRFLRGVNQPKLGWQPLLHRLCF